MPKLPRDISGKELVRILKKIGYSVTRQTGSHIRLSNTQSGSGHHITIPFHDSIKIGTLNNILNDLSGYLKIEKTELIKRLF